MKTINRKKVTELTESELGILSTILNTDIMLGNLPFLGKTVCYDGKRFTEKNELPDDSFFEVVLQERLDTGEVVRIYIGSKHHGQVLSCAIDHEGKQKWYNNYMAKNYGNRFASGGTWSGQGLKKEYDTWEEALDNRYDIEMETFKDMVLFRESSLFLDKLKEFMEAHA